MKRLFLILIALAAIMSMNAQIVKLWKDGQLVEKYNLIQADKVTFEEDPTIDRAMITGGEYVTWIQLWAGGPKFAEYNVGATSVSGYGGYYCWGNPHDQSSGWTGESGTEDIATALWGSKWRMLTIEEFEALLNTDNCTLESATVGGVNGFKFTGKGDYASNSVFLPAAGYCNSKFVGGQGGCAYYWSSTPNGSNEAYRLYFTGTPPRTSMLPQSRTNGFSVRAVLVEE